MAITKARKKEMTVKGIVMVSPGKRICQKESASRFHKSLIACNTLFSTLAMLEGVIPKERSTFELAL